MRSVNSFVDLDSDLFCKAERIVIDEAPALYKKNKYPLFYDVVFIFAEGVRLKNITLVKSYGIRFDGDTQTPKSILINEILDAVLNEKLSALKFISKHNSGLLFNTNENPGVFSDIRDSLKGLTEENPERFSLLLRAFSKHVTEHPDFSDGHSPVSSDDEKQSNEPQSKWKAINAVQDFPILAVLLEYFVAFFEKLLLLFSYEQKSAQAPMPPMFRA